MLTKVHQYQVKLCADGAARLLSSQAFYKPRTYLHLHVYLSTKNFTSIPFLTPKMNSVLDSNSSSVVIEAPIGSLIELQINGTPIDPNQVGQLETNTTSGLMRQTWYGVFFGQGDNTLKAIATLDGETAITESRVQAPGDVVALRLSTIEKRVPADGRSTVTVLGFLLDENGNIANRSGRVSLISSSGKFIGVDTGPDAEGFQVDAREGQFEATLQSSLESGLTQIKADMLDMEAFTQVQFETALRPSVATGVIDFRLGADNNNYFGSFSEFLDPNSDGDTILDVDGAAFAIGPIGDWLLTAAFNGDRPLNEACETCTNRLFRADQDSEKPYPTYGDESTVTNLTPSQDQVFVRLERSPGILGADPDYVMWGDYGTSREFATGSQEFSAFSRQLHGAKLNYNFGDLQFSGLFSQGGESFQRDTLIPDGTTGFYFLTQRLVVPGSEEIYLELEELERPGSVVQRDRLSRGTDYDIDYDRGTIIFEDPILRTEVGDLGETLVRRIVAAYQYESSQDNTIWGGRLKYNFNREQNNESWLGTTYWQEDKGERDLSVFGIDSQIAWNDNYKLIGEYAHSNNDSAVLGDVSGSAYRLEFDGKFSDSVSGRVYYRHADTEFSNQSTVSFVPGQTRYGAALNAKLSDTTRLNFKIDHEDNDGVNIRPIVTLGDLLAADAEGIPETSVDNRLTTVSAGITQKLGKSNLGLDLIYRDREDRINSDNSGSSTQLRSRFTTPLTQKLRLNLTNELTLSNSTDSAYSDRLRAGIDWKILPGVNVALNQNWYTRGSLAGQSTTSLNIGGSYRLWKGAEFTGRYNFENFNTGIEDTFGFGLKQRWTVSPGFHLDAAYEKVVGNLFFGGDGSVGQGGSRSTRVRDGDSFSFRASYTENPDFKAEAQFKWRDTNGGGSTTNLSASVLGKLSPSLTTLFNFDRRFAAGRATRDLPASTDIRLGLAYRNPYDDRFNALVRYEYRRNPDTIPETLLIGTGRGAKEHLFAGEMIYAPNWQWEFYSKLGYRFSSIDLADNFSASSSLGLAQVRVTYQMNRFVDLTLGGRWINQFSAGYSEMGWLGEIGVYATPNLRFAIGYSSGDINSDQDFSGTRAGGGLYAAATVKLDRLFGGFGLQDPLPKPQVTRQLMVENPEEDGTLQAALPETPPLRLDISQTIEFTPNTAAMSRQGEVVLDSLVTVLRQYPDLDIDIQGTLPPLATLTPDNIDIQRLQAARTYLLKRGITGDRIVIRSTGPLAQNKPEDLKKETLVSFALSGSADTFELLSSQVDNELVGSLLGESLPELASKPTEDDEAIATTVDDEKPVAFVDNEIVDTSITNEPTPVAALPSSLNNEGQNSTDTLSNFGEDVFDFNTLGTITLADEDAEFVGQRFDATDDVWSGLITDEVLSTQVLEVDQLEAFLTTGVLPLPESTDTLLTDRRIDQTENEADPLDNFLTSEILGEEVLTLTLLGDDIIDMVVLKL